MFPTKPNLHDHGPVSLPCWLLLAALITALGGCTDPELCKRGSTNCACLYDGNTADQGSCDSGLSCENGTCISDANTMEMMEQNLLCTIPQDTAPGMSGPEVSPISCPVLDTGNGTYNMTATEARERVCEAFCQRKEWFCGEPCDPAECARNPEGARALLESVGASLDCNAQCSGANTLSVECLTCACEALVFSNCENFSGAGGCQKGDLCGGAVCTNDCGYPADGACDDGDPGNADYSYCEWGTDCADCGVRRGNPPACIGLGGECFSDGGCCGNENNSAFCIPLDVGNEKVRVYRCLPSCESEDSCASGTVCDMEREPFVCLPACSQPLDAEVFVDAEPHDDMNRAGEGDMFGPDRTPRSDCSNAEFGTVGCPCTQGGGCTSMQLSCERSSNLCWPTQAPLPGGGAPDPNCGEGSEGCYCRPEGQCDGELVCMAGDSIQSFWVCR